MSINDMKNAVQDEIEAIRSSNRVTHYIGLNGRLVSKELNKHIYKFELEDDLRLPSDALVEITIPEKNNYKTNAHIVSLNENSLILSFEQNIGDHVSQIYIVNRMDYIWEVIKKKLEELHRDNRKLNRVSNILDSNINHGLATPITDLKYIDENGRVFTPNERQNKAIRVACGSDVSYIWGPPGTGKSRTISWIVQELIARGQKIVITSHTNIAVDNALKCILDLSFSKKLVDQNKIIRFGETEDDVCKKLSLEYIIENKIKHMKESLKDKLDGINLRLQEIKCKISSNNAKLYAYQDYLKYEKDKEESLRLYKKCELEIQNKYNLHNKSKYKLDQITEELATLKARNSFIRLFTNKKIENLSNEKVKIDKQIEELQENIYLLQNELAKYHNFIRTIDNKLSSSYFEGMKYMKDAAPLLKIENTNLEKEEVELKKQIQTIDEEIKNAGKTILKDATIVAITLSKMVISPEIAEYQHDAIIIDELSAVPPPLCLVASCAAKEKVIMVGDFYQLPPISISESKLAKKYLQKDLFIISNIINTSMIVQLNEQHRMPPDVVTILNEFIYTNDKKLVSPQYLIQDRSDNRYLAPFFKELHKNLILIDTSDANPWANTPMSGSKINIYSAQIIRNLIQKDLDTENSQIGIIAPYAKQAKLIRKMVEHSNISNKSVEANTIHSFQGDQKDIIIIDLTDGPGKDPQFLSETFEQRFAELSEGEITRVRKLLNVALSRAKRKIIFVANKNYFDTRLGNGEFVKNVLDRVYRIGVSIDSTNFIGNNDFNRVGVDFSGITTDSIFYNQDTYFSCLETEIRNARESVSIFSPYITNYRVNKLMPILIQARHRGISIHVFTKALEEYELNNNEAISQLQQLGCQINYRKKMHEKIVFIDRSIAFYGSLNTLSHRDTTETMVRLTGEETIKLLQQFLGCNTRIRHGTNIFVNGRTGNVLTIEQAKNKFKNLRWKIAEQRRIPQYAVLYNKTIDDLLQYKPREIDDLYDLLSEEKHFKNIVGFEDDIFQIINCVESSY